MNTTVELNSISMSKNDAKNTKFQKYDVQASIDEVENSEDSSVFKYGFTILSDPKNVRLSIEGIIRLEGDSSERDDILSNDDSNVPKILTLIYHELFPTFFLLSKSLNVSCPPHMIGSMGNAPVEEPEIESIAENTEAKPESDLQQNEEAPNEEIENPDIAQPTM